MQKNSKIIAKNDKAGPKGNLVLSVQQNCFLNIVKIITIVAVAKKTVRAKVSVLSQKLNAKIKTISPNPNPRFMLAEILRLKRLNTNINIRKRVSRKSSFAKFPFTIPARVNGSVIQ